MDPSSVGPLNPMLMIQQIQTLVVSVKVLIKPNEELRQRISHENSNVPYPRQCNRNNDNDEGYSASTNNREKSSRQTKRSNSSEQSNLDPGRQNNTIVTMISF